MVSWFGVLISLVGLDGLVGLDSLVGLVSSDSLHNQQPIYVYYYHNTCGGSHPSPIVIHCDKLTR
jgi:hypothetical protein